MDAPIVRDAFARHATVLEASMKTVLPNVERAAELILAALAGGGTILTCGNGGSAADAEHLAAEFVCKYKDDRRALPAIAFSANTEALTAIGNDYGFEKIFSRQVEALGKPGDVLIAFTTSGQSKNVLAALDAARAKRIKTIVMTGERGASLRERADLVVAVPSAETARIQEIHELIYHAWCEYVDQKLR